MDPVEPTIPCQRCGTPPATVAYGWALLCDPCKNNDDDFYQDTHDPQPHPSP